MNKCIFSLIVALFLVGALQDARSQARVEIGPRAGYEIDNLEEIFLGADARVTLAQLPVQINPTFDYYFVEGDANLYQFNINALYNFGYDNQVFTPYAGAGIGFTRIDTDFADDTETGFNLIGGATFGFRNLKPFAQAQITFNGNDNDLVTLGGGLLIALSQ